MMTQPTNLGAITERRIERVLTREGCMELALHQIIMKCDGSEMQTKRIRNIRERAKAGLEGRDPSGPGELGHVPPNRLLMAQLELSGKETDAARAERDALAAELKALRENVRLEAQCQRASGSLPDGWDITISIEKAPAGWICTAETKRLNCRVTAATSPAILKQPSTTPSQPPGRRHERRIPAHPPHRVEHLDRQGQQSPQVDCPR